MHIVLVGATPERARELAEPLRAEGYAPQLCTLDTADADIAATQATVVFMDLALGAPAIAALCSRIKGTSALVPPLVAILGKPSESDAELLIAGGANMFFESQETLGLRTRFLRTAIRGRAQFAKTLEDLRAAELRNEAMEREHREVLERAPNPVFVYRDGRIVWTNMQGARLLGTDSPADAVGLAVVDLVPEPSREMIEQRLRDRAVGKPGSPFEQTMVRRDGQQSHVWVVGMPTMFEGKPAVMTFVRDLTEQRRLETQLMAADRLASLGRLAASVGHEINNPLTYVLGNLELSTRALRTGRPGGEVIELLEAAIAGAEQVRRIVDDLRVFSQRNTESLTPVDLRAVAEACIRMTCGELRHRARIVQHLDDAPRVLAIEPRLAQVITNLLLNAAQSLPDGSADAHTVTVTGRRDGDHAELRIEDTGKGIAPEHLPHVFDPFFTTKTDDGGSGLGLAICKTLVAAQDGTLSIASEVGKGTCVTLRLRLATAASDAAGVAAAPEPVIPRRVLLVDDDANVAAVLREILEPHEVTLAASGREALGKLEAGNQFDVIVCDLMMPDLGGVDVHERIRVLYPGLERRIVFMTGGTFTPRASAFVASVPNMCLQKPFDVDALLGEIERIALSR